MQDAVERFNATPEARQMATRRFGLLTGGIEQIWASLTGSSDVSQARGRIRQWAEQHPLDESLAARTPTTNLLAALTTQSGLRPMQVAANVMAGLDDLSSRADLASAFLPKQARWQGEYFMMEAIADPSFHPSIPELAGLSQDLATVTRGLPALLDSQREATFDAIGGQQQQLQSFVAGERAAVMQDIDQQRVATLSKVDQMGKAWVDRSFDRMDRVVNRVLVGILLLFALMIAGGLTAIYLWRRGPIQGSKRWAGAEAPSRGSS
jgi:hypothetical protein